jgi:hypothetical protein
MKRIIFYTVFFTSVLINILYFYYIVDQKKHKDEFYSVFKIKKTNYDEGFLEFKEKLNAINNKTPYHLIHVWDTFLVDPTKSIPYFLEIDSFLKYNPSKTMDCILMSSMRGETIEGYLKSRKIKFTNVTLMNDMDNFVSGLCNKKNEKTKIHSANLLINEKGDILYYNDKIKCPLGEDSLFLKIFYSLK